LRFSLPISTGEEPSEIRTAMCRSVARPAAESVRVRRLLEADATYLNAAATPEQKAALAGQKQTRIKPAASGAARKRKPSGSVPSGMPRSTAPAPASAPEN
jgi:hypothetical protein